MKELQNFNSLNNNKLLVALPLSRVEDFLLNESLYALAQQDYSIDLLILTKGLNKEQIEAINKIASSPTIILSKKNDKNEIIKEEITALKDLNFTIIESESKTFSESFNEAFNYALKYNYEWFSMVEYDDIVDTKWFLNFINYQAVKPNVDGFTPLTRQISNGVFTGFFNEAPWVETFAEEAGMFDLNLLTRFNCMNITGTVFKTESLRSFSQVQGDNNYYKPIKESIKIDYIYEFFLRMIYNDLKFFSIPRLGYEHRIDRIEENVDYFSSKLPRDIVTKPAKNGGITDLEHKFWRELVKKEYYHAKDRNLKYEPK